MKIALGTAQFGLDYGIANKIGKVSQENVKEIIRFANVCGISYLDTAMSYGNAEKVLGLADVGNFNIITKLQKLPEDSDPESFVYSKIENSLAELRVKKLYGVLIHDPSIFKESHAMTIWNILKDLKKQGIVDKIGVSFYEPNEYLDICEDYEIDLVQVPYNLIDRRFMDSGVMELMKSKSIEIHTRSVFLQGLLTLSKVKQIELFPNHTGLWNSITKAIPDNLDAKLDSSLSFVVNNPLVDKIVVGVDSINHLKKIESLYHSSNFKVWPELTVDDNKLINPTNWNNR